MALYLSDLKKGEWCKSVGEYDSPGELIVRAEDKVYWDNEPVLGFGIDGVAWTTDPKVERVTVEHKTVPPPKVTFADIGLGEKFTFGPVTWIKVLACAGDNDYYALHTETKCFLKFDADEVVKRVKG